MNIYHKNLKDSFTIPAIESGIATHVVVGITWGANSVLSCEFPNYQNQDTKGLEEALMSQLKRGSQAISGKRASTQNRDNHNKELKCDISIFGDLLPPNQKLPDTFQEAFSLLKQISEQIPNSNHGRGKPLTYHLLPLSHLKNYLSFIMSGPSIIKQIDEGLSQKIVLIFDNISKAQQELGELLKNANKFKVCIKKEDIEEIARFKADSLSHETNFHNQLAIKISLVRNGTLDSVDLHLLLDEFQASKYSPKKICDKLKTWIKIAERTSFAKNLVVLGAKYIGFETSLDEEIVKNIEGTTFIIFFKEDSKTIEKEKWEKNVQIFSQEMKKKTAGHSFIAVDCDINPNMWPETGLSIHVSKNLDLLTSDLLKQHEESEESPYAKSSQRMSKSNLKPNKSVNLAIKCTGKSCNSTTNFDWVCPNCQENIEYGFDESFYCRCGQAPASTYRFKCPSVHHGAGYESHDENYLKELLSHLKPLKELNILILGETGVGKSTWINGFQNYLHYESLEEAEANVLFSLIPSQFTVCDESYNTITVSTGEDKNEIQSTGKSATQECKVYSFVRDNTKIKLIDTPGVGDTRGIDQDKMNFQNILKTLSYLEELHGICILLKPNNSRLNIMFKFCIKELLTYLHRDASSNIMFCFTNSRSTFYRPGDTMPVLRALLDESSIKIVL